MTKEKAIEKLKKIKDNFEVDLIIYPVCCGVPMEKVYDEKGKVIMHICRICKSVYKEKINEKY